MRVSKGEIAATRFGFGLHPMQPSPSDAGALIADLHAGAKAPLRVKIQNSEDRRERFSALQRTRRAGGDEALVKTMRREMRRDALRDGASMILQRAVSPHGFFERLAAFWVDHFTVAPRVSGHVFMVPTFEPGAIRPNITGRFAEMLTAVVQHPAMLVYLDQATSVGPRSRAGRKTGKGLNENLAREVLELHTLGVNGTYTQNDVREFAELLTGYGIDRKALQFGFFPRRAEPGSEEVLGQRYGGNPPRAEHALELLEDLAAHPQTARHLARKLCVHFVSDTPSDALTAHVTEAWRRTGGHLPSVYTALLEHDEAWGEPANKIRRPGELVIATLRAISSTAADAYIRHPRTPGQIHQMMRSLGQPIYRAPGPDGWPEDAQSWITPQGLAARLRFAGQAARLIARDRSLDPRSFARTALGNRLRPATEFVVGGAPDRIEGFALVLASPEFNRR